MIHGYDVKKTLFRSRVAGSLWSQPEIISADPPPRDLFLPPVMMVYKVSPFQGEAAHPTVFRETIDLEGGIVVTQRGRRHKYGKGQVPGYRERE